MGEYWFVCECGEATSDYTTDAKNKVPSAFSHKSLGRQASKLSTAYQQEAEELNIDQ